MKQWATLLSECCVHGGLRAGRVMEGASKHAIALMCAEKEPLDCHRTILVSRELVERGLDVCHILADGTIEAHSHSLRRLLDKFHLLEGQLFQTPAETDALAYAMQAEKIAYDKNAGASKGGSDTDSETDEARDES